jgi:hypothetical protein
MPGRRCLQRTEQGRKGNRRVMQEVDKNVFFYPLMRLFLSSFQANPSGKMRVPEETAKSENY